MEGTAGRAPSVAYTHMADKAAGDIAHVEAAWVVDRENAVLVAASLDQTCSHLPGMGQELPFFEDPLMDNRLYPAEVEEEY